MNPLSFPILKFSYATTPASDRDRDRDRSSSSSSWSHLSASSTTLTVTFTTQPLTGAVPSVRTLLKITKAAGTGAVEILEDLDLTWLIHEANRCVGQISTSSTTGKPKSPIAVIVRSPCLAVRYPMLATQQVRRFQVRFASDADYCRAVTVMQDAGCPITESPLAQVQMQTQSRVSTGQPQMATSSQFPMGMINAGMGSMQAPNVTSAAQYQVPLATSAPVPGSAMPSPTKPTFYEHQSQQQSIYSPAASVPAAASNWTTPSYVPPASVLTHTTAPVTPATSSWSAATPATNNGAMRPVSCGNFTAGVNAGAPGEPFQLNMAHDNSCDLRPGTAPFATHVTYNAISPLKKLAPTLLPSSDEVQGSAAEEPLALKLPPKRELPFASARNKSRLDTAAQPEQGAQERQEVTVQGHSMDSMDSAVSASTPTPASRVKKGATTGIRAGGASTGNGNGIRRTLGTNATRASGAKPFKSPLKKLQALAESRATGPGLSGLPNPGVSSGAGSGVGIGVGVGVEQSVATPAEQEQNECIGSVTMTSPPMLTPRSLPPESASMPPPLFKPTSTSAQAFFEHTEADGNAHLLLDRPCMDDTDLSAYASTPTPERMAALETWVCAQLEDDAFLTLCRDVEGVWQRIGYGF